MEQLVVHNGSSFQSGIRCEHFRNLDSISDQQAKRTTVIDRSDRVKFKKNQDAEPLHQLVSTDHAGGLNDVFRFIKDAEKTSKIVK
jgi:hypothetical protein